MRPLKIFIPPLLLSSCLIYGFCIGRYKWFPFEQLAVIKSTLSQIKKLNNYLPTAGLAKTNNIDSTLAELAKTNNIELNDRLKVLNLISSSKKSNSIKFISLGDITLKTTKGLLNSINLQNSSLIVHVGDTLPSGSLCEDYEIDNQRELINNFNSPVLYTPGDNEWRDCIDEDKGEFYNLERLSYIRKSYFSKNQTLGRNPSVVENQRMRGYPENARLMKNNIAFITAHLVGSQNNFDPFSKENILEFIQRDKANIEWIIKSFEKLKESSAFVVITHGDIFGKKKKPFFYEKFANTLLELSNKYKRPVLLLCGNIHEFKSFQPAKRKFPFMHVIQNFGPPDNKAIEIEVNPSKKIPFNVIELIE